MKNYLSTYGTRTHIQMFQEGGPMPAPEAGGMPPEGGAPAEGGEDPQAQLMALAQAAAQGDQAAATELGMMLAPMILEQAGGGAPAGGPEGGAPMPEGGGAPQFRKGGRLA